MGLFTRKDERLVKWALPGEYIPLKCQRCGAIFVTKNRGPLGEYDIRYGKDYNKSSKCVQDKHHLILLVPDKRIYNMGDY